MSQRKSIAKLRLLMHPALLLVLSIFLSSCHDLHEKATGVIPNKGHPGDPTIVYVACRDLDFEQPVKLSDIAELKRAQFQAGNDLHRIQDFIGKIPKNTIFKGETINDLKIEAPAEQLLPSNTKESPKIDRSKCSQSVPVNKGKVDIPQGGAVYEDNLEQVMVPYSQVPNEAITELQDEMSGSPATPMLANKSIPKGTIVTYDYIVPLSSESYIRAFVATKDLPKGTVLMPPDLVAVIDEDEANQRYAAILDNQREKLKELHKDKFSFNDWYKSRLDKPLKKGEMLTEDAVGPPMTEIAYAKHDLKPGVALKESDVAMKFIETSKQNPQKDIYFFENAVGVIPKKLIKSGEKIDSDDVDYPEENE